MESFQLPPSLSVFRVDWTSTAVGAVSSAPKKRCAAVDSPNETSSRGCLCSRQSVDSEVKGQIKRTLVDSKIIYRVGRAVHWQCHRCPSDARRYGFAQILFSLISPVSPKMGRAMPSHVPRHSSDTTKRPLEDVNMEIKSCDTPLSMLSRLDGPCLIKWCGKDGINRD